MKKIKQMQMITGYYTQSTRNEHYIFIKHTNKDGSVYYSKCVCINPDFYSRMMKKEISEVKVW